MAWDETDPAYNSKIKLGDDSIRTFKTDVRTAFTEEHDFPVNAASPIARHKFPYGATADRPSATATSRRLYINTTTKTIDFESSSAWAACATLIPSGTVMAFFQAAAPLGWTQITTYSDHVMRIVSTAGGVAGGTNNFSTCFSGQTTGSDGAHTHTISTDGVNYQAGASGLTQVTSATTSSNGAHTHTVPNFAPKYLDFILCSKD